MKNSYQSMVTRDDWKSIFYRYNICENSTFVVSFHIDSPEIEMIHYLSASDPYEGSKYSNLIFLPT
jgi:lipopolysaccharide biosynthesis glycosyltransferase